MKNKEVAEYISGRDVTAVCSLESVSAMQQVAGQFGVSVVVLKQAGEKYTVYHGEAVATAKGHQSVVTSTVPEGRAFIQIQRIQDPRQDLESFWNAVEEISAKSK